LTAEYLINVKTEYIATDLIDTADSGLYPPNLESKSSYPI